MKKNLRTVIGFGVALELATGARIAAPTTGR